MKDILQVRKVSSLLLVLAAALFPSVVSAQVFPVQANVQLQAPYSPYLTDLTAPGAQKFMVQLRANDIAISDHPIKLRITIEGVGITIRTKQSFIPQQPLTLYGGGIPTIFYGEDLLEYFNASNLDFAGLSRNQFLKTGRLPEGVYRFSVEVFSYNRDVQLSNKAMTTAWIILNDPPLLNLPRRDLKVRVLDPTNIVFTWTPRHTGSPNSAFTTEYTFRLVEIWPANRNPYDAFLSQPVLYETTTAQTQILYGPAEPALIPGRKYAWQVQASDTDGRDLFKNQGRSEVFVFQFGDPVNAPENIKQDIGNATTINLTWEPPTQGEMPREYRVRYRKKGSAESGVWYEALTSQRWVSLTSLPPNTSYEVQVRSEARPQVSEFSPLQYVRTDEETIAPYTCGKQTEIPPVSNTSPLLMLSAGDVITASNFKVIVTEAKGGNGTYSGRGVMSVPFFNMATVNVMFSGIQLNERYELVYGEIVTTFNPGSEITKKIEEAQKIGEKPDPIPQKADSLLQTPSVLITLREGVIDSIYFDPETKEIVVIDAEGNKNTYKQPTTSDSTKAPVPVIIVDSERNTYTVDKEGKVTKIEGGGLKQGSATSPDVAALNVIKENILGIILSDFKEEIAAWLRINGKGGEEDEDILLALALPECFPQDADKLEHINESTIPYFQNHKSELQQKIEVDQTNKELFDRVGKTFLGKQVVWSDVSAEDQTAITNATCKAIVSTLQIDVPSERTYVTPAGTLLKLPSNHQVNNICIDQSLYPNGSLLNFTVNNKTYFAKIRASGTPYFDGYYEIINQAYGDAYNDPNQYTATKTDVSFVERIIGTDGKTTGGKIYIGEYVLSDTRTNQQIASAGGIPVNFFSPPEAKVNTSAVNISFGDCPALALDDYIKNSKLQKWLSSKGFKADVYLSDCLTGKTTHITDNGTTTANHTTAKQQYDNGLFTSDIAVWACWDGEQWKVEHKYKPGAINPTHAKIKADLTEINKEIDRRIDKLISDANSGNGSPKSDVTYDYGEDGQVHLEGMDFLEAIIAVKDFSKTLVNYAKIPEQTWDSKNNADEYGKYPVHVPPMLAGAGDQTLEEMTGALQFVSFGLDLATDPEIAKQTWEQISGLSPADVKKMIVDAAQSKADKYAEGGVIARHEAGADIVTVAVTVVSAYKAIAQARKLIGDSGKKAKELAGEADDAAKNIARKLDNSVEPDVPNKIDDAIKRGEVDTETLEEATAEIQDIAASKKKKLSWPEIQALFKRGNDFNRKARESRWYQYDEVHLSNGKRLDSYDAIKGEIVSRKATTLSEIKLETFEGYLKEMHSKYPSGTVIRSNKFKEIDGLKLEGKQILEIPSSNQNFPKIKEYMDLAKKYSIELRFKSE